MGRTSIKNPEQHCIIDYWDSSDFEGDPEVEEAEEVSLGCLRLRLSESNRCLSAIFASIGSGVHRLLDTFLSVLDFRVCFSFFKYFTFNGL